MLPSPSGCWLDPRGYSFSRPQCVHCCYGPVTRNLPWGGLVDRLRRFCFHLLRYPNYGALTSTPAGLSPAEHASLDWTHNRTCSFPAYGSHLGCLTAGLAALRTRSSASDTLFPALCPARAASVRVLLGLRPSLHRLRCRSPGLVRQLRCCRVGRGGADRPASARS